MHFKYLLTFALQKWTIFNNRTNEPLDQQFKVLDHTIFHTLLIYDMENKTNDSDLSILMSYVKILGCIL